ncbi:MAG: two-component system activity regulator YycH [Bacillota bacterium]
MVESIKSILLLLLVGLSLLLTYQLWYGQNPTQMLEQDVYERVVIEEPRELEEILDPEKIVLHDNGKFYLYKKSEPDFEQMWEFLSFAMQRTTLDAALDEEEIPAESRQILSCYMQPALPVGDDQPWISEAPYKEIETIEVYSKNDSTWLTLKGSDDNKYSILLSPRKAEQLNSLLAEIQTDRKVAYALLTEDMITYSEGSPVEIQDSLYVPSEKVFMNELNISPEQLDQDLILKTFFVDYSMARVIEEKDGALIYTDGEKGLRLSSTGLEFSSPLREEGQAAPTYSDALITGSSLIGYHGGWLDNLRLTSLELTGWGQSSLYSAKWHMYVDGYPIYMKSPTLVLFNDNGLIHYTRNLYQVENSFIPETGRVSVATWDNAVSKAMDFHSRNNPNGKDSLLINDIYLGYVITTSPSGYIGRPAWLITINNQQYILTAFQLDLLREEDLF